jgi:hypothetical protein
MALKINQTFLTNPLGIMNWDAVVTVWLFIFAGLKFCEIWVEKVYVTILTINYCKDQKNTLT